MKEVIVHPLPTITATIEEAPIPEPRPHEVLIKVHAAGSNVKDWLHITRANISINSGDDIAGTIHALGADVKKRAEFRIGDRVAAMHPMLTPGGAYAEYAIAPAHTTFILPETTSFQEAATLPLITLTSALSLFQRQALPPPWSPLPPFSKPLPLIIYGASSALGATSIKLARLANIHPIIAVAGASHAYISTLLDPSKGDSLIDYRAGIAKMKQDVRAALNGQACSHALDAISAQGTWVALAQMLDPAQPGIVSVVSGGNAYDEEAMPENVLIRYTYVGTVHDGAYRLGMPRQPPAEEAEADPEFAYLLLRYVGRMLAEGKFEGHPVEVIPGGLAGVGTGLARLKAGEAKGVKFVYLIGEA